jgi:tripeptidyl-peptidase-1
VHEFLSANGLTANTISPAGDWISFNTTVEHANDLFGAEYSNYLHMDSGVQSLHTLEYSIPTALKGHLHVLHPGISCAPPPVSLNTTR